MTAFELWRDLQTGELWAVKLVDGVVAGSCGPLDRSDADQAFLRSYEYDAGHAAWMESCRDRFALHTDVSLRHEEGRTKT